ncbi:histidinol dehydrogenase [Mesonia sp. K7]|uniref:histidinol dehydrogenase n=1 Tax=Mesonia sp. K7 TaxID=2218606 RepID=UPI000DA74F55|nr:histidinol dehydrogenase [Mesonia sp. K7]PZD76664.1 histidinol dehydrogenase [Mesonia sp. K7]
MKKIYNPTQDSWETILQRPQSSSTEEIEETIKTIFTDVQQKGDQAITKYTRLFDGSNLNDYRVSQNEIEIAVNDVSEPLKKAIQLAKKNIETFHQAQLTKSEVIETQKGVVCWQEKRPIEKVGLYIPGGTAPLFSTVLMLVIPAKLAGCKEIVLCTPPNEQGKVASAILYAAHVCGVTTILKVGGIQAIAGLTFGTKQIPRVYKIFGPGNVYVTAAKQYATKFNVAIDMPAGPSELLVFADNTADASFVASDLLSQAEHGSDSQVILVTTSSKLIDLVEKEIENQINLLPRKAIAIKAIENSKLILVENNKEAMHLINLYAPEHFIVISEDEDFFIHNIQNAGSVFIGHYTPESAGDYASGTNHTLPTNGYAKQYSGVNLDSFMKNISFQKISEGGIQNIGKTIEIMAEAEGLQAHKNAVTLRLRSLKLKANGK